MKFARLLVWNCVLVLALSCALALPARAQQQIVVPNALASTEGNTDNIFPFFPDFFGPMRYQQVYAATQFSALPGPASITQITFRPDADYGAAFTDTNPGVRIRLSTTSKAPDGLSGTFEENVGPDVVTVYSGPLTLSSAFTGPGPKDFDIVIHLTTPFVYNPAAGNLLLEVVSESTVFSYAFDAEETEGDPVSRVFTTDSDPTSPTGLADTFGLVTRFTFGISPLLVSIDIKPGGSANPINLRSRGKVPVAILSTAAFDATTVDPSTVTLAEAPVVRKPRGKLMASIEDVNGDALPDLVLHFFTRDLHLSPSDTSAVLEGETFLGIPIQGSDTVKIVP